MTTPFSTSKFHFSQPNCLTIFFLLIGLSFPAAVSAQLVTAPTVTFGYTTLKKGQADYTATETNSIVGTDVVWSCDVTYVDPMSPGQTRLFKYAINNGSFTNITLTEGVAHNFTGSNAITSDYSKLEVEGIHVRGLNFTGNWTWNSSNPDPVITDQDPPNPCGDGNESCGEDGMPGGEQPVMYSPVCPPNSLLAGPNWSTLYSVAGQAGSGCSSCGGSSAPGSAGADNLIAVNLGFIPSNQQSIGNLSPGTYLGIDHRIEFHLVNGTKVAVLFDPISGRAHYAEFDVTSSTYVFQIDVDGVATDTTVYFMSIALEDGSSNTVTDPDTIAMQTVYAIVKSRSGWTWKSELVDVDPGTAVAPMSRLTEITSPTGKVQTLTYKYNAGDPALTGAPKKILMVDVQTDWQGNTATYTYNSAQQAGRWVVSDIDIVAQGNSGTVDRSLRFTYNGNGYLYQVFRKIGTLAEETIATYTYGTDTQWQAATIVMDEQFGAVPMEQTLYVSQDYRTWEDELVNQFSNVLVGAADGAGIRYLTVFRDMDNPGNYRIKENDDLIEWVDGVSVTACSSYTEGTGQGYGNFTSITYELDYPEYTDATGNNPPTAAQVLLGQPAMVDDGSIRSAVTPSYDSNGNTTRIDYADTSYELWQYNGDNQVTYYRDQEGIVTLTEYNTDGQVIRIVRGLVDVSGPGSEIADTNTTPIQNIRGYNSNGQLEWEATNAYAAGAITAPATNLRTDYVYKSNKQLEKILKPLAPGQSSRPETQYSWEGENLVSMTVVRSSGNETTTYAYDSRNRLVKTTYPDATTEEIAYTSNGLTTYRKDRSNIVSATTLDSTGRVSSRSQTLAYDTDLTNVDINGIPATIFERLSDQVSTTNFFYSPGETRPNKTITDGKTTEYSYDHKGRQTETLRYTGTRGGTEQAQATRTEYKENMRFSEESIFGTVSTGTFTPVYTRKTYLGYAADGTTVRTVQVANTSTTYADNTAVMNASRPSSTAANPSILITDAIRDLSGNIVSLINPLNTTQLTAYDTLGRSLSQKPDSVNFSNLISTSEYDVWGNATKSTNPAGVETTRQYDASGQYQISQIHGANASSLSAKTEFTYDRSGRRKSVIAPGTNGLPDSNRTTTTFYDAACCGQTMGIRDALGHGQIRSSDPSGRVVHIAQVTDYDTHNSLLNPTDAKTNGEATTRYLDDGRVQFRTKWTQALNENINRNLPQLAGLGKPASWGVTTQYVYDTAVGDGVGLETTAGVDVLRISTSQKCCGLYRGSDYQTG